MKSSGIGVLDRNKYTGKSWNILDTEQLQKLDWDPTKSIEAKNQRAVRKITDQVSKQEYTILYPTSSAPWKLYGTPKKHKIPVNRTINNFSLCPIISNIGTASYELAKYLAKLLSHLGISGHTIANNMEFINTSKQWKNQKTIVLSHLMFNCCLLLCFCTIYKLCYN